MAKHHKIFIAFLILLGVVMTIYMQGCKEAQGDLTDSSIDITWTSTGDDGMTGQATCLEVAITKDSTLAIEQWPRMYCDSLPVPLAPGETQTYTITGLDSDTKYFIRIRLSDEVPNWSGWSNWKIETTRDNTPPATVMDLR
jgi:hypothetical protein